MKDKVVTKIIKKILYKYHFSISNDQCHFSPYLRT